MGQLTLASQGRFTKFLKPTGREKFLEEMERIMPWAELERLIEPHSPKEGNDPSAGGTEGDAVLLPIDSAAALKEEDIGTLRLLYEAGIPALVLLSKADLLEQENRDRVSRYIAQQVHRELNLELAVHSVSTIQEYASLLDRFFEQELLPRFEQGALCAKHRRPQNWVAARIRHRRSRNIP